MPIHFEDLPSRGDIIDMAAWLRENSEDNHQQLQRMKRNLQLARQRELTQRQQQLLHMRFEENMSVTEIARALGISKSSVSRTLRRGQQRLQRCLRYSL